MAKTEVDPAPDQPQPKQRRHKPAPGPAPAPPPSPKDRVPKILTFVQQVEKIPAEDWGTRATIKLYRLEPVIDRLRTTDNKYICVYRDPPVNEERIKVEHGSGRYRLYLNYKLPATAEGKEIDSVEFDILDHNYPPKIAKGEWLDSPHNVKWQWAKAILERQEQAAAPPVQAPPSDPMQHFETYLRIEDRVAERAKTAGASDSNPVQLGMSIAKEMLTLRSDNPMMDIMRDELKSMRDEMRLERQENMKLQSELRQQQAAPQATPQNGLTTMRDFLGTVKELLPAVKEIFPNATEAVAGAVSGRSRMNSWQEFFQPVLPELTRAIGPVLPMLVNGFLNRGPAPGVQANPGQAALPAGQRVNPLITFLNNITTPMLHYLRKYAAGDQESDGEVFAEQLFDMYGPTTPEGINWHEAAKQAGVVNLVGVYRQSPYWPQIGPIEPKFVEFLTQFLGSAPGQQEEPPESTEPEVIDLTQSEGDAELYG
jgi:hypothetical protein